MADRNSVADWDTTATNNDNIGGTTLGTNMFGSDVNDAFQKIMAQAKTKFDALDSGLQPGSVFHTARSTAPTGALKANGAAISRTTYAALFAAIGTTYGVGNGTTTFNIPDLRAEFIRGLDDGRAIDTGRTLGSAQTDQNKAHTHTGTTAAGGSHTHTGTAASGGSHSHTGTASSSGAHSHTVAGTASQNPGATTSGSAGFTNTTATTSTDGAHTHSLTIDAGGAHTHSLSIDASATHTHTLTTDSSGGTEVRVRNVALLACIQY